VYKRQHLKSSLSHIKGVLIVSREVKRYIEVMRVSSDMYADLKLVKTFIRMGGKLCKLSKGISHKQIHYKFSLFELFSISPLDFNDSNYISCSSSQTICKHDNITIRKFSFQFQFVYEVLNWISSLFSFKSIRKYSPINC